MGGVALPPATVSNSFVVSSFVRSMCLSCCCAGAPLHSEQDNGISGDCAVPQDPFMFPIRERILPGHLENNQRKSKNLAIAVKGGGSKI